MHSRSAIYAINLAQEGDVRVPIQCLLITILVFAASGCSWRNDFTALSTKNVSLNDLQVDASKSKGRVQGRSCQDVVIVFPINFETPNASEAVDRALERANAQVLLNAVLEYENFYIPLIYGRECYFAEGDAYDAL